MINKLLILCIFTLLIVCCSPKEHEFKEEEFFGTYEANFGKKPNNLIILKNGNYVQEVVFGGHTEKNSNSWMKTEYDGDIYLKLAGFLDSENTTNDGKMDWMLRPEKTGRIGLGDAAINQVRLRFCVNIDLDYCYIKIGDAH